MIKYRFLWFLLGLMFGAAIHGLLPRHYVPIVTKEHAALLVRAHHICYTSIVADWAEMDSTYIPLDELDSIYLNQCGLFIDSIMTTE